MSGKGLIKRKGGYKILPKFLEMASTEQQGQKLTRHITYSLLHVSDTILSR